MSRSHLVRETKFRRVRRGEAIICSPAAIDDVHSPAHSPALKRDWSEQSFAERVASDVAVQPCIYDGVPPSVGCYVLVYLLLLLVVVMK
jgi:hypothetical protein